MDVRADDPPPPPPPRATICPPPRRAPSDARPGRRRGRPRRLSRSARARAGSRARSRRPRCPRRRSRPRAWSRAGEASDGVIALAREENFLSVRANRSVVVQKHSCAKSNDDREFLSLPAGAPHTSSNAASRKSSLIHPTICGRRARVGSASRRRGRSRSFTRRAGFRSSLLLFSRVAAAAAARRRHEARFRARGARMGLTLRARDQRQRRARV